MRSREKLAWLSVIMLSPFVIAAMSGVVSGGSLEPPGPVGSTMKTLEEIPGSWSRALDTTGTDACNTERFRCVLNDEAVLDRETGVVWQRVTSEFPEWFHDARDFCMTASTGGRRGWRLPTIQELMSLSLSPTGLPANHPFTAVGQFWSTTTGTFGDDTTLWGMYTPDGSVDTYTRAVDQLKYWCVRGGIGDDS